MKECVKIIVNGKEYKIRFSMNNIIDLEELTAKSISEIKGEKLADIRAMVYCTFSPSLKNIREAGDILDEVMEENGIEYLIDKITEAMELALGKQKQKQRQKK